MKTKVCFASDIVFSDDFCDLPASAQLLYLRFLAEANPDGRLSNIRQIVRAAGASEADVAELVEAGYLLDLDNKIFYIRDYWLHNKFDRANCRRVGESPELQSGTVVFCGDEHKSRYRLAEPGEGCEKASRSLSEVDAKSRNGKNNTMQNNVTVMQYNENQFKRIESGFAASEPYQPEAAPPPSLRDVAASLAYQAGLEARGR